MSTISVGDPTPEPRPVIPALGRFYRFTSDLAYVVVRLTAGIMLIPHGWPKWGRGPDAIANMLANNYGIPGGRVAALIIMLLETVGGVMIAIGAFTRVVAALLVLEFLVIIFVAHWPKGYAVSAGGIEYPLFWGLILLAILLRGGGPWSVDRKLGWEV